MTAAKAVVEAVKVSRRAADAMDRYVRERHNPAPGGAAFPPA